MKKVMMVLLVCMICTTGWAANDEINDKSIAQFIELFPQYKLLIEEFGKEAPVDQAISAVAQNKATLDEFFASHNITLQDFATLVQKITIGYTSAKIKNEGDGSDPFGLAKLGSLTDNERAAIDNNFEALKHIFEVDEPTPQE